MIWSPNTGKVYIGSTTQPLYKRWWEHKSRAANRRTTANDIIDLGDAKIELIEEYPCASKNELDRREGQIIRERTCVNMVIPGRTPAEYYQDNKERIAEYRQENKERMKEYRQDNKDALAAHMKEYRQIPAVKERIVSQTKAWYQRNKERIVAQKREYDQRPDVKARRAERRQQKKQEQNPAN